MSDERLEAILADMADEIVWAGAAYKPNEFDDLARDLRDCRQRSAALEAALRQIADWRCSRIEDAVFIANGTLRKLEAKR